MWLGPGNGPTLSDVKHELGRYGNMRAEYMMNINGRGYPDTPTSTVQTCPIVKNQTYDINTFHTGGNNSGFDPSHPYQITFPTENKVVTFINGAAKQQSLPVNTAINGFQRPIIA